MAEGCGGERFRLTWGFQCAKRFAMGKPKDHFDGLVDLARRAQVSHTHLSNVIHGRRRIGTWQAAERLERLTGIQVRYWLEPRADLIRKGLGLAA